MTKWRFIEIDPRKLLTDQNSRTIEDIETERPRLCASIEKHGVKIPVIANPTDDGRYRVRDGHCRTLIAQKHVKLRPTIDVAVTESTDVEDWHRLRDLYVYNHHRDGFSASDTARLMAELALFDLSPEEIATELSEDVTVVNAGLAVHRSPRTAAASQQNPHWDLFTLHALTEFEDDADAHQELLDTLQDEPDEFDYTVRRLHAERERRESLEAARRQLRDAGIAVIDANATVDDDGLRDTTALPLERLYVSTVDRTLLTADSHVDCPGHSAVVRQGFGGNPAITYVCVDFAEHGHVDTVAVAVQDTIAELESVGTTIVDVDCPDTTEVLSNLLASADDRAALTPDSHQHCPGHAAHVTPGWRGKPRVTYVCVDYADHGHVRDNSAAEAAATAAEFKKWETRRARVNNPDWEEKAKPRRRDWLRTFFADLLADSKVPVPSAAEDIVLEAMNLPGDRMNKAKGKGNLLACELLKLKAPKPSATHPIDVKRKRSSKALKVKIMLAIVLGAYEEYYDFEHSKTTWRSPYDEDRFYFTALKKLGFKQLHVERLVLEPHADADNWAYLRPASSATPLMADRQASAADQPVVNPPVDAVDELDVDEEPDQPHETVLVASESGTEERDDKAEELADVA